MQISTQETIRGKSHGMGYSVYFLHMKDDRIDDDISMKITVTDHRQRLSHEDVEDSERR